MGHFAPGVSAGRDIRSTGPTGVRSSRARALNDTWSPGHMTYVLGPSEGK